MKTGHNLWQRSMTPLGSPTISGDDLANAARLLRDGGLVAFPTETVYGLGADASNDKAVARIFAAKGRPTFNPLIVHVADIRMARQLIELPPTALKLAEAFWPGALTLVGKRQANCTASELASAGLDTLAVRVPAHSLAQDLIRSFGGPLAAPSANASEEISPTTSAHVAESLGPNVDMIIDGGPCEVGLESTIIGFDEDTPVLLRLGGISRDEIESIAGPLAAHEGSSINAPGQMARHYAPHATLRLNAEGPKPDELWLGFGKDDHDGLNLSPESDLTEAASHLYAYLRQLDSEHPSGIAVARIPNEGLGEAINDRLARAAAPIGEVQ